MKLPRNNLKAKDEDGIIFVSQEFSVNIIVGSLCPGEPYTRHKVPIVERKFMFGDAKILQDI